MWLLIHPYIIGSFCSMHKVQSLWQLEKMEKKEGKSRVQSSVDCLQIFPTNDFKILLTTFLNI
jgi:hypothetical protein